jgi:hypothetical protein
MQPVQTLSSSNTGDAALGKDQDRVDWSTLAFALEEDFHDGILDMEDSNWDDMITEATSDTNGSTANKSVEQWEEEMQSHEAHENGEYELAAFFKNPKEWVTKTCRSELVDALLSSNGDVENERFVKALNVLSTIYASSNYDLQRTSSSDGNNNNRISNYFNGSWVTLSRPAYVGCLGKNDDGDFIYTLGAMSFGIFKPEHLRCSIQHSMNDIRFVCRMDEAPTAAPWSLRRELAVFDPENPDQESISSNATLRAYE